MAIAPDTEDLPASDVCLWCGAEHDPSEDCVRSVIFPPRSEHARSLGLPDFEGGLFVDEPDDIDIHTDVPEAPPPAAEEPVPPMEDRMDDEGDRGTLIAGLDDERRALRAAVEDRIAFERQRVANEALIRQRLEGELDELRVAVASAREEADAERERLLAEMDELRDAAEAGVAAQENRVVAEREQLAEERVRVGEERARLTDEFDQLRADLERAAAAAQERIVAEAGAAMGKLGTELHELAAEYESYRTHIEQTVAEELDREKQRLAAEAQAIRDELAAEKQQLTDDAQAVRAELAAERHALEDDRARFEAAAADRRQELEWIGKEKARLETERRRLEEVSAALGDLHRRLAADREQMVGDMQRLLKA